MHLQNDNPLSKKALAYLSALTLIFSYAEMILPRIFPFFKLGFANIVILLALDVNIGSYLLLSILKAFVSSLMGGTLFSPFFFISLLQSLASALLMRFLYKCISKKAISLYGISAAASAISALIQILLSGLYLGKGSYALLGPMLIFNTFSGLITAFICEKLEIKDKVIFIEEVVQKDTIEADACNAKENKVSGALRIFFTVLLVGLSVFIFFISNLYVLALLFLVSLIIQKLAKRKIFILPHLSLWLFVFLSVIFLPNGKVLFTFLNLSVTEGALVMAARKALTLSTVAALSQSAVGLKPGSNSFLGLCLEYYRLMGDRFMHSQGSLINRLIASLAQPFQDFQRDKENQLNLSNPGNK